MNKYIDLHTHTTASDGTYTPEALIDYAAIKGLSAIAITDHDTLDAIEPALNHGKKHYPDIEIIPGIEFSTHSDICQSDIHILGYYITIHDANFLNQLKKLINSRDIRNEKMIALMQSKGMAITLDDVLATSDDGVITRAHFAKAMENLGIVKKMNKAFDRFIGNGKPCYVAREKVTQKMAIEMITKNGGVAALAHPVLYNMNLKKLDSLLGELTAYGLKGIEGIYSTYKTHETAYIADMAKSHGLIVTGGSDFHGSHKPRIDLGVGYGSLKVPYAIRNQLYDLHVGRS